ncbi:hypothetical protein J437_LFUL007000 [Ladona fulva]|uniref:Alpha-1,2-Mannosidase n=1 Tax=Ladona fulva TaxID=123851 RepID=A0A8K0K3L3_LADFU|nr:hypothetical protein J437_LFUL007000 [Ladona fulva]
MYVNVNMMNGAIQTSWIDSLQAAFAGVQATKNPFYLHVGVEILESLNKFAKARCGYATVHSVLDKSLEDRMESFFLSETCKYLYLLFDKDNYVNKHFSKFLFTTEGHIFPIKSKFRLKAWDSQISPVVNTNPVLSFVDASPLNSSSYMSCEAVDAERSYFLPIKSHYLMQISDILGVDVY